MTITKKVYYHDTDAGGVVYYGRYLNYLEEARTEFLNQLGFNVKSLNDDGYIFAVKSCHIAYEKPARYGDVLECSAIVKEVSAVRIIFDQVIKNSHSNETIAVAEIQLVSLCGTSFKPKKMPKGLFEALKI